MLNSLKASGKQRSFHTGREKLKATESPRFSTVTKKAGERLDNLDYRCREITELSTARTKRNIILGIKMPKQGVKNKKNNDKDNEDKKSK